MFNPFVPFSKKYVDFFRKAKLQFLVSQTFTREDTLFKDDKKTYLLMSYYNDIGRAEQHLNAIKLDPLATTINLENEQQRNDLMSKLMDADYVVYCAFVQDKEKVNSTIKKLYGDKIKKYIEYYKNWHIGRDQVVNSDLEITFGELFIHLHCGSLKARLPLEQIENLR